MVARRWRQVSRTYRVLVDRGNSEGHDAMGLRSVSKYAMFRIMRNKPFLETDRFDGEPPSEAQLLKALSEVLRARLPASWALELTPQVRRGGRQLDAVLSLGSPDDASASIVVEVKRRIDPRDVPYLVEQLRRYALPEEGQLVVAPFLGTRTRNLLAEAGVGYMDATGNLRLALDRPAVYIEREGAAKNPWRESQPLRSLKGPTDGRAARALCDFRPPYGIRELAERSRTPAPIVSRVAALLEREALLTRDSAGRVLDVKWLELIGRWTEDYGLTKSNRVRTFLEPRGLDALLQKLSGVRWSYAVTGSLAAMRVAPIAPPRLAVIYVNESDRATDDLALHRAERGTNVLLVEPFDRVVFDRTAEQEGVTYAALSQVAADLLTSPGRGPQEGQELLRWMEENEDAWRQ